MDMSGFCWGPQWASWSKLPSPSLLEEEVLCVKCQLSWVGIYIYVEGGFMGLSAWSLSLRKGSKIKALGRKPYPLRKCRLGCNREKYSSSNKITVYLFLSHTRVQKKAVKVLEAALIRKHSRTQVLGTLLLRQSNVVLTLRAKEPY